MNILSILVFFISTLGLGFSLTKLLRIKIEDFYERNISRIGFGMATIVIFTALFPIFRIPLSIKIVLFLSIIYPVYYFLRNFKSITRHMRSKKFKKEITPSLIFILLIGLFAFNFYMYHKGAFSYRYLEDDDPWDHALAIEYITKTGTVFEPIQGVNVFKYLDARPPGYDGTLALMHQVSPDIMWTIKFFNVLLISMGILFFFYFAKIILRGSGQKALLATFFLSMFPSYLTHFIWSHGFAMSMIIFTLYCLLRFKEDIKTSLVCALPIAASLLLSETEAIKLAILIILLFVGKLIVTKKIDKKIMITSVLGLLIASAIWWFPMITKYGANGLLSVGIRGGKNMSIQTYVAPSLKDVPFFGIRGSATDQHGVYTLKDIFFAKGQNFINVPIGVGWMLMILIIIGFIYLIIKYKRVIKRPMELALVLWFIFAFFGSNGGTRWWSPFALFTFRFWLLFSIFGSIIAVYGAYLLFSFVKPLGIPKLAVLSLIVVLVWFSSGAQKFQVNTSQWTPGASFTSMDEVNLYNWLESNLPPESKVMSFSQKNFVIAYNMLYCAWCPQVRTFKKDIINKTPDETHKFMKSEGYNYLVLDVMSIWDYQKLFGNETQNILFSRFQEYVNSTNLFRPIYQNKGGVVLQII